MVTIFKKNNFLIYGVALLPILSLKLVSISIILFVIGSILAFNYSGKQQNNFHKAIGLIILLSFPFYMNLIWLIWTENIHQGLNSIEKSLSFLIFPLTIFLLSPLKTVRQIKIFYKTYIISCLISNIITLIYIFINLNQILSQKNDYQISTKLRQSFESVPVIGEHPIYFSLLLAVALLILYSNRFKNNTLNIICALILLLGIFVASSKGVLLSLLVVIITIVLRSKKNRTYRYVVLFLILFGTCFTYFFPPIKARINEIIETKNFYPQGVHYNSFNLRMAIYNCSLTIIKEAPIMGYAPGDAQKELDICYKQYDTKAFDYENYNTHNQYLNYLASFGIIGFVFILFCFYTFLKNSLKTDNKLYFNFLILFFIAFLTENILSRNTGIVLFSSFNSLFAYISFQNIKLKNDNN